MKESILSESVTLSIQGYYLLRPPVQGEGSLLLVGFHGYAENAEIHLARMQEIPGSDDYWICSVQALHPFYLRKTGEVVASWMTRFHRETAIRENLSFVGAVVRQVRETVSSLVPMVFFGFSQGAAMAYRAAAHVEDSPQGLIVLGGDLPPDLRELEPLKLPPTLVGRGSNDPFYRENDFNRDIEVLKKRGIPVTRCLYEGRHEWNPEFATHVAAFLE